MGQRLKILHTMTWLAPGGGADTNVFLSIRELMPDYELHLTTGPTIYQNEFEKLEGLPIHICPHLVRPIHPLKDLKALWWYYRLIRRERYDIVHTHESKSSIIVKLAAWLARTPFIIYGLHGVHFNAALSRPKRWLYILIEHLTIWTSDLIISVSQNCLDEYEAENLGRHIPSMVIHSGIETERFIRESALSDDERQARRAELGIGPAEPVLVNVGRFSYNKAQRYTIEAFARLKPSNPELKLLLVGEGELKDDCRRLAEEFDVAEDVIFYGFTESVGSVMRLADINVLTSLTEGLPRVVVEAALVQLPTVAFEVQGIHEILRNGESGYVVPQFHVSALVDRLDRLLANPSLRTSMAAKAHEQARTHWDYRVMVRHLGTVYNNWARQHKPEALPPSAQEASSESERQKSVAQSTQH